MRPAHSAGYLYFVVLRTHHYHTPALRCTIASLLASATSLLQLHVSYMSRTAVVHVPAVRSSVSTFRRDTCVLASPTCAHAEFYSARHIDISPTSVAYHFCPENDDLPCSSSAMRYHLHAGALGGLGDIQLRHSYARYPPCAKVRHLPLSQANQGAATTPTPASLSFCLSARLCPPVQFPRTHLAVMPCTQQQHTCFT